MDADELARFEAYALALGRAVDAKGSYAPSHSDAVSSLCGEISLVLELDHAHRTRIRLAGLLHDVGKIWVDDAIVHKPARLSPAEMAAMRRHSEFGAEICVRAGLEEEARWVLHHHERYDGAGYPHGLAGDEIPLESRIIAAADAYAVMTGERHYRTPVSATAALAELDRHAGGQFDPDCAAAIARCRGIDHPSTHPAAA